MGGFGTAPLVMVGNISLSLRVGDWQVGVTTVWSTPPPHRQLYDRGLHNADLRDFQSRWASRSTFDPVRSLGSGTARRGRVLLELNQVENRVNRRDTQRNI